MILHIFLDGLECGNWHFMGYSLPKPLIEVRSIGAVRRDCRMYGIFYFGIPICAVADGFEGYTDIFGLCSDCCKVILLIWHQSMSFVLARNSKLT